MSHIILIISLAKANLFNCPGRYVCDVNLVTLLSNSSGKWCFHEIVKEYGCGAVNRRKNAGEALVPIRCSEHIAFLCHGPGKHKDIRKK